MVDEDLARAIEDDHRALDALICGDAKLKKQMFSTREDVTLANAVRPAVRGREAVEAVLVAWPRRSGTASPIASNA
jgi:hypothetical protein